MKNILIKSACFIMLVMVAFSCTTTKEVENLIAKAQIEGLEQSLNTLKKEKKDANFGYKEGDYPPESVKILDDAMTSVNALLSKIYDRADVSDQEFNAETAKASKAITDFKATRNKEDYPPHTLITKYNVLKKEMDDATFGLDEGNYPPESKDILQKPMNVLVELVGKIRAGQTVSDADIKKAIDAADAAIVEFRATKLDEPRIPEPEDVKALRVCLQTLVDEKDAAPFGPRKDQYPKKSVTILDDAMAAINKLIDRIKNDLVYTKADLDNACNSATKAINDFRATKRTKDADKIVVADGGWIEFGTDAQALDFLQFGKFRDQVYTIELWIKVGENCPADRAFLSTFIEKNGGDGNPKPERCGWFINYWDGNNPRLRMGWAGDARWFLYEPWFRYAKSEGWVHFAVVYNDKGVDGGIDMSKLYRNGVLMAHGWNMIPENPWCGHYNGDHPETRELWNNIYRDDRPDYDPPRLFGAPAPFERRPMIGFGQANPYGRDGAVDVIWRRSTGSMKNIRIWTTAKTQTQIQGLMNGTTAVTGTEADLRCYWKLVNEDAQGNTIKDITGKYEAFLKDNVKWVYDE